MQIYKNLIFFSLQGVGKQVIDTFVVSFILIYMTEINFNEYLSTL